MYSGEYDACNVTLSVYPHQASLKIIPDHGGNQYITSITRNQDWKSAFKKGSGYENGIRAYPTSYPGSFHYEFGAYLV
jgi:hypothetical protein